MRRHRKTLTYLLTYSLLPRVDKYRGLDSKGLGIIGWLQVEAPPTPLTCDAIKLRELNKRRCAPQLGGQCDALSQSIREFHYSSVGKMEGNVHA